MRQNRHVGLTGRKAGNLKEVGLEWINGGRKDRGFGWGKMVEDLLVNSCFLKTWVKSGIEESVGVCSRGRKEEE